MTALQLHNVSRKTGAATVLDHVSFRAEPGEFVALVGPSGAGKTSVIRALAGFDPIDSGTIQFDDEDVTRLTPQERDIAVVSQDQTLFLTHRVRKNLSFPLLARAFRRDEITKRVAAESRAMNIDHILDRWPSKLSAGEQQLTQIARALVRVPRLFLMDEPLANLDPPTKRRLQVELVQLQRGYGVTTVYVATRPHEIMTMPNRVVALDRGRVVQVASPEELRQSPAAISVASLTGPMGWLHGKLARDETGHVVKGEHFQLRAWGPQLARHLGEDVTVGVRPQDVELTTSGGLAFDAAGTTYDGSRILRELRSSDGCVLTPDGSLEPGETVRVHLRRWHLFHRQGHRIATQGASG